MPKISELTATTTPADANELAIVQSGSTLKITFANLVAGVKTSLQAATSWISSTVLADSAVSNAKINNGAVTDAKVSASAAIAPTKIADDATYVRMLATERTALAAKAADSAVVHLTGNETVAGTKTFSSAPAVPDASFAIAKTSGLQTALDAKLASTAVLTQEASVLAGLATGLAWVVVLTYTAAAALGARPALPTGYVVMIVGGTTGDTDPAWMATSDFRIAATS